MPLELQRPLILKRIQALNLAPGDLYLSLAYSHEFSSGIELAATLAYYDFDDGLGDDYNHYNIRASRNNFTLAIDVTNHLTSDNDTTLSLALFKNI